MDILGSADRLESPKSQSSEGNCDSDTTWVAPGSKPKPKQVKKKFRSFKLHPEVISPPISSLEKASGTCVREIQGKKCVICTDCFKAYNSLSILKIHRRRHTGEGLHFCNYCDKGFTFKGNRDVHIRIHTGEKPFFCSKCNKAFAYSQSLKQHKCAV